MGSVSALVVDCGITSVACFIASPWPGSFSLYGILACIRTFHLMSFLAYVAPCPRLFGTSLCARLPLGLTYVSARGVYLSMCCIVLSVGVYLSMSWVVMCMSLGSWIVLQVWGLLHVAWVARSFSPGRGASADAAVAGSGEARLAGRTGAIIASLLLQLWRRLLLTTYHLTFDDLPHTTHDLQLTTYATSTTLRRPAAR